MDSLVHRYLDRCGLIGVLVVNDIFPLHSIAGMLNCKLVALAGEPHSVSKVDISDIGTYVICCPYIGPAVWEGDAT